MFSTAEAVSDRRTLKIGIEVSWKIYFPFIKTINLTIPNDKVWPFKSKSSQSRPVASTCAQWHFGAHFLHAAHCHWKHLHGDWKMKTFGIPADVEAPNGCRFTMPSAKLWCQILSFPEVADTNKKTQTVDLIPDAKK